MKCSLDISNFLEEISSLSHSILYLYFFSLFIEEGLLISSWYSQVLCIHMGIYFPFSLAFHFSFSLAICKGPSDNHFAFLYFFFFGMILVTASYTMLQITVHSYSGSLSTRSIPLCDYTVTSTVESQGIWFRLYLSGLVAFLTFFTWILQ